MASVLTECLLPNQLYVNPETANKYIVQKNQNWKRLRRRVAVNKAGSRLVTVNVVKGEKLKVALA